MKPSICPWCNSSEFWQEGKIWICYGCGGKLEPSIEFHKKLLKKYISYVGEVEGMTFIPRNMQDSLQHTPNPFTEAELAELHKLEAEVDDFRHTVNQLAKLHTLESDDRISQT